MIHKIRAYFEQELDVEIGGFQAEFLIDNRGLYDAEALLNKKVAEISDTLLELEKPVS